MDERKGYVDSIDAMLEGTKQMRELYQNELTTLKAQGMIDISNRYLHLTPYGMRFGNRVFETFV